MEESRTPACGLLLDDLDLTSLQQPAATPACHSYQSRRRGEKTKSIFYHLRIQRKFTWLMRKGRHVANWHLRPSSDHHFFWMKKLKGLVHATENPKKTWKLERRSRGGGSGIVRSTDHRRRIRNQNGWKIRGKHHSAKAKYGDSIALQSILKFSQQTNLNWTLGSEGAASTSIHGPTEARRPLNDPLD